MAQLGLQLESFQFDVGAQTGKQMVALRRRGARRRFRQRGVLFQRFVIDLDAPPFLEELRDLVISERQRARYQVAHARRTVVVCEDLFDQKHRKRHLFKPNLTGRVCGSIEGTDCHVLTMLFGGFAHGDLAVVLERHDELLVEVTFDVLHIVGGGVPQIVEHVLKRHLIMHRNAQQHPVTRVFRDRAAPLGFARLLVHVWLGLLDQIKGDGQRDLAHRVEGGQEFDPFDVAFQRVAPMPADEVVFVRVRLLAQTVINAQAAVGLLDVADERFDDAPQIGAVFGRFGQKAGHLIVAHGPVEQACQAGRGGGTEGANQVVGVEVEQLVFHLSSVPCGPLSA